MKDWFYRFKSGRRGMDALNRMLIITGLLCMVLSVALTKLSVSFLSTLTSTVGIFCILYFAIRFMSRNISSRDQENYKYLNYLARKKNERQAAAERRKQKEYKFFKCPGCGNWLRVPKGKGKIHISCKCGYTLYRKT